MENNEKHESSENKDDQDSSSVVGGDVSQPLKKASGKLDFLKKKPVMLAIAAVLVAGGIAGVVLTQGDKSPVTDSRDEINARIGVTPTIVDGTATYKTGSGDWQALTTETNLSEGDWVSADSGSRVVLSFDDGSALRLDAATIVQLTSLDTDDIKIDQTAGTAYSRVVTSERKFTVNVDETGYTAVGTAFTTINSETDKGCQVIQSQVKVDGMDDSVAEGKQYFKKHSNADLVDKTTDISLDELKSSAFMLWNLEQDEANDQFKDKLGYLAQIKETTPEPEEAPESTTAIKLSAKNNDKGTVLSWSASGIDVSDGFKVVRSKNVSTPTYGNDEAQYVDSGVRSLTWKGDQYQKEYWYRVCAYRPDQKSCASYSNAVKITSVYIVPPKVTRGTMTLTENSGLLTWNYTGSAIYGYKVVISSDSNPTYPDDEYVYYGSDNSYALDLSGKPDGTYHVRVCAYTSGSEAEKCVDYSNDVVITKP
jgi:hypothetical protein